VDIIKEVARYYSLPVLDLFATAGIQPKLAVQKEALCPDGLHPNDAGYRRITDRLAAFLLAL
jgi:lysophospholipase L1-like esterase